MALLAVQDATNGASITFGACNGGGDTIPQGSRAAGWELAVVLIVKCADTTSMTVTVGSNAPITVPATTGEAVIPVFGVQYGQAVAVAYSKVTSATCAAVKV